MNENDTPNTARGENTDAIGPEHFKALGPLLRAYADGELDADGVARVEALITRHPELRSCVAFEQSLKGSCAKSMDAGVCCPDALRAKVMGIAASTAAAAQADDAATPHLETPHPATTMAPQTRERSFWTRGRALGAMAAALLIASGALIYSSSTLITGSSGFEMPQPTQVSYDERVGNFVSREHQRCTIEQAAQAKFVFQDLESVSERYSDAFGTPVSLPEIPQDSGIVFYGGGDCHLPATNLSAHLRFDVANTDEPTRVSVFIAPSPGLLELEEGVCYAVNSTACDKVGASLYVWERDGLMYVLVSETQPGSGHCKNVRSALNAPETLRSL